MLRRPELVGLSARLGALGAPPGPATTEAVFGRLVDVLGLPPPRKKRRFQPELRSFLECLDRSWDDADARRDCCEDFESYPKCDALLDALEDRLEAQAGRRRRALLGTAAAALGAAAVHYRPALAEAAHSFGGAAAQQVVVPVLREALVAPRGGLAASLVLKALGVGGSAAGAAGAAYYLGLVAPTLGAMRAAGEFLHGAWPQRAGAAKASDTPQAPPEDQFKEAVAQIDTATGIVGSRHAELTKAFATARDALREEMRKGTPEEAAHLRSLIDRAAGVVDFLLKTPPADLDDVSKREELKRIARGEDLPTGSPD